MSESGLRSSGHAVSAGVALPAASDIAEDVARALREDVGAGDLTAALIPAERRAVAVVISREAGMLAGCAWFEAVYRQVDSDVAIAWSASDGDRLVADQRICQITGSARSLLTAERTALNFLQTLSATATETRRYVDALAGLQTRILDTRKTIPGLRLAQKYAVRCGGGSNHRTGLFDAVLIKENHIMAAGGIKAAVAAARAHGAGSWVEVETENLDELREALDARADRIMLDNFDLAMMRDAVAINRSSSCPAILEASGNVSLAGLRAIAETGVDDISVGALTKHLRALDLSMRFE